MSNQSSINETTNGRWTKEEHQKFLVGLQMFGKNWKKIEGFIGTRNGSQIRSHAQKFFIKVKKTLQTEESDSQNDVVSTIQEQPSNQIEKSNDHSYFFQQIVKRSQNEQSFNFWAELIDQSSQNIKENIQIRRKNSFISFQSGQDSNNQLQLGSEPRKRIKI